MKRSKPPVLTSPWKIGFFVALMLVAVGSAVTFFFVRQTGLTWSTPRWTDWNSVLASVLDNEGTIFEMWPLLTVVSLSALLCYFVISRAVRKYKSYLDSGHDYKELLVSIREIDDLEDKKSIQRLKNHPELRDFLLDIRNSANARTKELDERERSLERRAEGDVAQIEEDFHNRVSVDCGRLITAIRASASDDFPDALEIVMPALQDVERELRAVMTGRDRATGGGVFDGAPEIASGLEVGIETGREVEKQLRDAKESAPVIDTSYARGEMEALVASLTDTKQLSARLGEMSEDAKNVAINTAFKAGSGSGTQTDLIDLADDVKEIAARFGEVANSWGTLAESMGGHVNAIEGELTRFIDWFNANSSSSETITSAADKLSRCVEHLVVVGEKLKTATQAPPAFSGNDGDLQDTPPARDFDEVDLDGPSGQAEAAAAGRATEFDVADHGFETMDESKPLFSNDDSGEALFEKQPEQVISPDEPAGMFAELNDEAVANDDVQIEDQPADPKITDTPTDPPAAGSAPAEDNGFIMERNIVDLPGTNKEPAAVAVEEDAIDLYALGAVDFDAALHN